MTQSNTSSLVAGQPAIELAPPSMTVRIGGRRLTLSWRARKPLPALLAGLLRRSWRKVLAPMLRVSVAAAAVCGAWQAPVMAAAPAPGTLPAGWQVVNGNVVFTQNGSTLNINQLTPQAIANFDTFSIGSGAAVNISQPSAAAAFLARVTGGDISQIYGTLTANGTVVLFNPNGIFIGPGGLVDVTRFIATTLNITDADFLAGKYNFAKQGTAGTVENQGTIKSASGGSVYLIGSAVTNGGIIQSPQGEVILAAGETVSLVDTATPGVSVAVTGSAGNVTNLGTITAEAGRIGIAAGLITNSGNISASSVVKEGGRVFLRASQNLTTTASSNISADGTTGGNIVLYSDNKAYIDGDVSALGSAGNGGFVETSGLKQLDVVNVPKVGAGGTWYIDPYNLEVVADDNVANNVTSAGNAVTSNNTSSRISNGTINGMLNGGASVVLATGNGGSEAGDILINADIEKTTCGTASLTLNAHNNISINANISATSGTLSLTARTNYQDSATGTTGVTLSNGTIKLNGGTFNVYNGSDAATDGNLIIASNGTLDLGYGGSLYAGNLTVNTLGNVSTDGANKLVMTGTVRNSGTFTLTDTEFNTTSFTSNGSATLSNVSGSVGSISNSGTMALSNIDQSLAGSSLSNSGTMTLSGLLSGLGYSITNNGTMSFENVVSYTGSTLASSNGSLTISNSTMSVTNLSISGGTATLNLGSRITGTIKNAATLNIDGSAGQVKVEGGLVNSGSMSVVGEMLTNTTVTNTANGTLTLGRTQLGANITGTGEWVNEGTATVSGTGSSSQIEGAFLNNGTLTMSGAGVSLKTGDFTNNGVVSVSGSDTNLEVSSFTNAGNVSLNGGSILVTDDFNNNEGGTVKGSGTITAYSRFYNNGTVSPGGNGTIGTLTINSVYDQGSTGSLLIDIAGPGSDEYDKLIVNTEDGAIYLDGTLKTTLLNGYQPTLETSFNAIQGPKETSGVFRHVLGDVFTVNGAKQMIKATAQSGSGVRLTMSGSETLTFDGNSEGSSWGNSEFWSTGYFPTAIDNVIVSANANLSHFASDGTDIVNSITVQSGGGLSIFGGTVNVTTLNSQGDVYIGYDGTLGLSGKARVRSLTIDTGSGRINGGDNSVLNVTDEFTQRGGSIVSTGTVALSQSDDSESGADLAVGNITARNLVLESQGGAITQKTDTSLHVTKQLITASVTGTELGNSGNRIAAYAGNNSGTGNIHLVNSLATADASVVTLNGITNTNGNIVIDNTGGMQTAALGSNADFLADIPTESGTSPTVASQLAILGVGTSGVVKASNGSVNLTTHSPLTIGSPGVQASGGITLSAGSSGDPTGNLVINGVLNAGGNIQLSAGNSTAVNANLVSSGTVNYSPTPTFAPGVSVTSSSGTVVPNPVTSSSSGGSSTTTDNTSQSQQATQQQQNVQTQTLQASLNNVDQINGGQNQGDQAVTQTGSSGQTVGGAPGTFGDESGGSQDKRKNLPMCT